VVVVACDEGEELSFYGPAIDCPRAMIPSLFPS